MARRTARYELRRTLWQVSNLRRLKNCGRARTGDHVGVRSGSGSSGFSGLQHCGSVWACPCCSAVVSARRSVEIGCGLLAWERMGGRLLMGTLTMRHHRGHRLASEWDALASAWDSVIRSQVWKRWKDRLGMVGNLRVVEVTDGDNGWHAHLHLVLLIGGDAEALELVNEFTSWLLSKWARALEKRGFPGALDVGQDVHLVEGIEAAAQVGEYLSKASAYGTSESVGRELLGSWTKGARGTWSTVPAWRLAEQFAATGEADLLDRWHEYEKASKGRRQVTWSRGLRDLLDLDAELSDEAVAAEEVGTVDLLRLDKHAWAMVLAQPWPTSRLLDVLDKRGLSGLRAFLDANGILYTLTPEGTTEPCSEPPAPSAPRPTSDGSPVENSRHESLPLNEPTLPRSWRSSATPSAPTASPGLAATAPASASSSPAPSDSPEPDTPLAELRATHSRHS